MQDGTPQQYNCPVEHETTGREYVKKLADVVRRDMAAGPNAEANSCGALAACGVAVPAAGLGILLAWAYFSMPLKVRGAMPALAIILVPLATFAAMAAFTAAKRWALGRSKWSTEQQLAKYMAHFRRVLFDEGLLALVLANDPRELVPGVAQFQGLLAIPLGSTAEHRGSMAERIDLLVLCYGLICRHYRIEPYPPDCGYDSPAVQHVGLKGLPRTALILTIDEGLYGKR